MAVKLKSTDDASASWVKMLVYGQAGAGKTTLIPSLPNPVVLSAEGGLLSIKGAGIQYIDIRTMDDIAEAYEWALTCPYDTIAIDSLSEIAEVVLSDEKKKSKDPRQAYGATQDRMYELIRAFRDIDKHIYMTCKMEKSQDDTGRVMYAPMMPGNKLSQAIPYFFDLVMALRVEKTEEGTVRYLQTESDGIYQAKARGYSLDQFEPADMSALLRKMGVIK